MIINQATGVMRGSAKTHCTKKDGKFDTYPYHTLMTCLLSGTEMHATADVNGARGFTPPINDAHYKTLRLSFQNKFTICNGDRHS